MLVSRCSRTADPVVMSRTIARSLLADIHASNGEAVESLNVRNVLRLLKMYNTDTYYARTPMGILERDSFRDLNNFRSEAASRLRVALKATHESVSPELSVGDFTSRFADLLEKLESRTATAEDRGEVEVFVSSLANSLSNV